MFVDGTGKRIKSLISPLGEKMYVEPGMSIAVFVLSIFRRIEKQSALSPVHLFREDLASLAMMRDCKCLRQERVSNIDCPSCWTINSWK